MLNRVLAVYLWNLRIINLTCFIFIFSLLQ